MIGEDDAEYVFCPSASVDSVTVIVVVKVFRLGLLLEDPFCVVATLLSVVFCWCSGRSRNGCGGGGVRKGLNCATSSSRLFSRGAPSRCFTFSWLDGDSWMISHRTPSSSPFLAPFSRFSIVLCKVNITSSGLRSAELPFSHGFSCCCRTAGGVKIELKDSGVVGGGIPEVTDRGRWREKKDERFRSVA